MARISNIRAFFQGIDDQQAYDIKSQEARDRKRKAEQDWLFQQTAEDRLANAELRRTEQFNLEAPIRQGTATRAEEANRQFTEALPITQETFSIGLDNQGAVNRAAKDTAETRYGLIAQAGEVKNQAQQIALDSARNYQSLVQSNPKALDPKYRASVASLTASGVYTPENAASELGITMPEPVKSASLQFKTQWIADTVKALDAGAAADAAIKASGIKQENAIELATTKGDINKAVVAIKADSAEAIAQAKIDAKATSGKPITPLALPAGLLPTNTVSQVAPQDQQIVNTLSDQGVRKLTIQLEIEKLKRANTTLSGEAFKANALKLANLNAELAAMTQTPSAAQVRTNTLPILR